MTTNQHYWSPSAAAFFSDLIHGPRKIAAEQTEREIEKGKRPKMVPNPDTLIPDDAVPITDEKYHDLFDAQANGQQIVDYRGKPRAIDRVDTVEEITARNRRIRDRLLRESDWTQLADALADQPELKEAWASYRQALRDMGLSTELVDEDWPPAPSSEQGGDA